MPLPCRVQPHAHHRSSQRSKSDERRYRQHSSTGRRSHLGDTLEKHMDIGIAALDGLAGGLIGNKNRPREVEYSCRIDDGTHWGQCGLQEVRRNASTGEGMNMTTMDTTLTDARFWVH